MKTGAIIAIILILFVAVIGVIWLSGGDDDLDVLNINATSTSQLDQTPTTTEEVNLTGDLRTYESDDFDFTFNYPAQAEASVEEDRAVVIYIGPDAIPNSEITDGFMFGVRTEAYTSESDVEGVAEALFEENTESRRVIASTTEITLGGETAYQFQVESELGTTITYLVFQADDGQVFVVDYFVADPADRGYENVIEQMMESLQYEADEEATATTT